MPRLSYMEHVDPDLATAFRVALARQRLTPSQVARELGLTESFLCLLTSGKRDPSCRTLRQIVTRLGISLDEVWQVRPHMSSQHTVKGHTKGSGKATP
jgi:transcriptional regulator with XRE-family HTH domain